MDEKKVINSLDEIEKIGIGEVARVTHIEPEYIKYITEKNYEKLKTKNIKCFIKIIEREYNLDLTDWIDEYNAYNEEGWTKENEPVFSNSVKQKEIVIKDGKKAPSYLFWLIFLIILGFVVFKFELYDFERFFPKQSSTNATYQNNTAPVVKEVENKLENVGLIKVNQEQDVSLKIEDKDSKLNALEMMTNLEESNSSNSEEDVLNLENNESLDENSSLVQNETPLSSNEASIVPVEKIWIGVIDLKSGKKDTLTTDKEYKINLDKEQLILTGHGIFTLNVGGKEEKLNSKDPYRLHVANGKVEKIDYDEFIKLNKGKAW